MFNNGFNSGSAFNRFTNLDNIEWSIINYLINSKTKYANNLWKILKYDTEDCLLREEVTRQERLNLVYTNNGDASVKRVFITPFIDDAWTQQSSHLHIFLGPIEPTNHLNAVVNIIIETIVHNKISNILGDATADDPTAIAANPTEFNENEEPIILYKNRESVMLKSILADLNGRFVNGVGVMQYNRGLSSYSASKPYLWNNNSFYGHSTTFCTMMAGDSENSECGF